MIIPAQYPAPLRPGDRVAIVSPSGRVKEEFVTAAADILSAQGWCPYIAPHALGEWGTYAASDDGRFADLCDALLEPSVRAVFCSRGGYGAVHLLERLGALPIGADPKWLIGYSDISALHGLMLNKGVISIHGPMARHLATSGGEDGDSQLLFATLRGQRPDFAFAAHSLNRQGSVTASLVGGNLAVIMGLLGTPYDVIRPGSILFVEDISEPIYKVERQLYQLHLSGALRRLRGLIFGQFTEYVPDVNSASMEEMISRILTGAGYDSMPVAFGAPVGHVDHNVPVLSGARATLSVTPSRVTVTYYPGGKCSMESV